jgi:hypothetical protein
MASSVPNKRNLVEVRGDAPRRHGEHFEFSEIPRSPCPGSTDIALKLDHLTKTEEAAAEHVG